MSFTRLTEIMTEADLIGIALAVCGRVVKKGGREGVGVVEFDRFGLDNTGVCI